MTAVIANDTLEGLPALGTQMGGFITNIAPALLFIGIIIAVIVGVVGIFGGVVYLMKGMLKGKRL